MSKKVLLLIAGAISSCLAAVFGALIAQRKSNDQTIEEPVAVPPTPEPKPVIRPAATRFSLRWQRLLGIAAFLIGALIFAGGTVSAMLSEATDDRDPVIDCSSVVFGSATGVDAPRNIKCTQPPNHDQGLAILISLSAVGIALIVCGIEVICSAAERMDAWKIAELTA